jgi:hypothetical protein
MYTYSAWMALLEGPPTVGHVGAAGVRGSALVTVVQLARLLEHEVHKSEMDVCTLLNKRLST